MGKIIPLFILFSIYIGSLSAQKNEVLLTIGDAEISKAEFERIYRKNNQNLSEEADIKSPKEYLELFINFKLKVMEAMNQKMDTASTFKNELAGYRKELAAPYLTDMKYDEALLHEMYRRMKMEVNASHILLLIEENADREREKTVFEKINKVREEILAGMDFNAAAFQYSEDPSAKTNKGNLGYFTAFQMVTPFENAVFNTREGEVSEPVRTSFGYHLIKVHGVRENRGEIKVAHIMKMFPKGEANFDKSKLKAEIDSVYEKLLNGADFAEMAHKYSEDKRSAAKGGEMPWFSASRMVPEFSQAAFALKNNGDLSPPVETDFGYHIIKKVEHRPVPSFEEARANIVERIKKDPQRSSSTRKALVEKLKKKYGFEENRENLEKIASLTTDANLPGNPVLFSIDNRHFSLEDFKKYIDEKKINRGTLSSLYEDWTVAEIIDLEDSKLEKKYPEFRYLMQEYHDGLLLFNIMEEKIWNFAPEDSLGLKEFYKKNKRQYSWEERFKGLVVVCKNEKTRAEAEKYFAAEMPASEVEDLLNKDEKMIEITEGAWEKGANPIVDFYVWNSQAPDGFDSELTFIRGEKVQPQPKTLEEARGMYISDYQNHLEKQWIKDLRKKYKIRVNKKMLKTIPHVSKTL